MIRPIPAAKMGDGMPPVMTAEKGRELVFLGEELLLNHERVVERVSAADVVARDLRIGVTELTALTWLPRLVEELAQQFPHVSVEHHVADSASLFDGLDVRC
jgi:DNA-binding transcriptional LysR family regulator